MILEDNSTRLSDFGVVRIDGLHCNLGSICHPLSHRIYSIWSATPRAHYVVASHTARALHVLLKSRTVSVYRKLITYHVIGSCHRLCHSLSLVTNIMHGDGWAFVVPFQSRISTCTAHDTWLHGHARTSTMTFYLTAN